MGETSASKALWRVLVVLRSAPADSSSDDQGWAPAEELKGWTGTDAEVHTLKSPNTEAFTSELQAFKPRLVYFSGGFQLDSGGQRAHSPAPAAEIVFGPLASAELFSSSSVDTVYLEASCSTQQVEGLREAGVRNVVYWGASHQAHALSAAHFGKAFFGTLRLTTVTPSEAFAIASQAVQVHFAHHNVGPAWSSASPPSLPDASTVPLPTVQGMDLTQGLVVAVPHWQDVRLLAPNAELRLLLCGHASVIDAHRLGYLGEALRSLLVLEMRRLTVGRQIAQEVKPAHTPANCNAARCEIRSASGGHATVLLVAPAHVLGQAALVEHALRLTLVADALSLQFKLPPAGVAVPPPRALAGVAQGSAVLDALLVSSVWAVQVLGHLCKDAGYQGLVNLGIAAVGGTAVSAFAPADASLYTVIRAADSQHQATAGASQAMQGQLSRFGSGQGVPQRTPLAAANGAGLPQAPPATAPPATKSGSKRKAEGGSGYGAISAEEWREIQQSRRDGKPRPALHKCSEGEFLEDVAAFLEVQRGKALDRARFPEAILNGTQLDLFHLYKEVVTRGGYKLGNGINWKGQVFSAMRNFTETHKMTGVGNALKRHYQIYLLDYEQAHPEDVTKDGCSICGGGDESATDWISCDVCSDWVHFSCDERPLLGSFKDYAQGKGRNYICQRCSDPQQGQGSGSH